MISTAGRRAAAGGNQINWCIWEAASCDAQCTGRVLQRHIWGPRGSWAGHPRLKSAHPASTPMGVLVWSGNDHSGFFASLSFSATEFLATKAVDEWMLEEGSGSLILLPAYYLSKGRQGHISTVQWMITFVTYKIKILKPWRPVINAALVKRSLTMQTIQQDPHSTWQANLF